MRDYGLDFDQCKQDLDNLTTVVAYWAAEFLMIPGSLDIQEQFEHRAAKTGKERLEMGFMLSQLEGLWSFVHEQSEFHQGDVMEFGILTQAVSEICSAHFYDGYNGRSFWCGGDGIHGTSGALEKLCKIGYARYKLLQHDGPLSIHELSLVTKLNERTIKNAISSKLDGKLIAYKGADDFGRQGTLIDPTEALRWISNRRDQVDLWPLEETHLYAETLLSAQSEPEKFAATIAKIIEAGDKDPALNSSQHKEAYENHRSIFQRWCKEDFIEDGSAILAFANMFWMPPPKLCGQLASMRMHQQIPLESKKR